MVVREDGTKWACQSCLKGHRVSGCTHTDRELTLVPKKGRPVTQCHHCRHERKKRSAHVQCDCGAAEKAHHAKDRCIHLRDAEERSRLGHHDDHPHHELDSARLAAVAEEQGCCCHHGGKCTCALQKREIESSGLTSHGPAVKPRLEKTTSDGAITVFTNGYHKPVHRKNHAVHESGLPYKMPSSKNHGEHSISALARRSVDNLALESNKAYESELLAFHPDQAFNTGRRKSKSEQPSPRLAGASSACHGLGDEQLAAIDFSNLSQTQTNSSYQSATSNQVFTSIDPMSGVTDGSFDPWSSFPSSDSGCMPNNNPFGALPSSSEGVFNGQPALTAASSGTQSEIDDLAPIDYHMPPIQEDAGDFDINDFVTNNSPQFNRRSLPPGFFGNVDFGVEGLSSGWSGTGGDYSISRTQKSQVTSSPLFSDAWQMSNMPQILTVPQRALGAMPATPRAQSRSVGAYNAPNDEIIRQLFPEIDITNATAPATDSSQFNVTAAGRSFAMSGMSPTSAPYDFGPMDESVGFISQPFSDGSMSIPNDNFTDFQELNYGLSNHDLSSNWPQ